MFASPSQLRTSLRKAGISNAAIDAAWPQWWSDEAAQSSSATAELNFTLARRLGLSPKSLLNEEPVFLWRNEAKYKNLKFDIGEDEAALTSFGLSVGKMALGATVAVNIPQNDASSIRDSLLKMFEFVDLKALLFLCWSLGVPVAQLHVFPLDSKQMHAMTVEDSGRFAVLLGHESRFSAQYAFTVAHELGHIFLGHFSAQSAIVDMRDPVGEDESDDEETAATRFALELLTGHPSFVVETNNSDFTSGQLARSALEASQLNGIDPGMIALSLGHESHRWKQAIGALKIISESQGTPLIVNRVAEREFKWRTLSDDNEIYLRRVLELAEPTLA
jgi:hypothetical protein